MLSPAHPCRAILLLTLAGAALAFTTPHLRAEPAPASAAPAELTETLTAIPEPGILVSLFGGIGVLLGLQRFRRRS